VKLAIDRQYLSVFNTDKDGWELIAGEYKVWVGGSSRNLPLSKTVSIGE
jgi:hypothetical protein